MTEHSEGFSIETYDLKKTYRMGLVTVHALNGISLKIKHGEMVSVVGPSGSGKSTLLNMLGALDTPTSGKILVDGTDITRLGERALSKFRNKKIGFVFQSYNLIDRSKGAKNVELPAIVAGMPKKLRNERVHELLDLVGLGDKTNRKPHALSGGEQQRVAIARALMNDPAFILADEPTGNLDTKNAQKVIQVLQILKGQGKTIIVSTHDMQITQLADQVLYLKEGRLASEDE
jgi:putative ABC transport system ATP-binding protein